MPVALNESSNVYMASSRSWKISVAYPVFAHMFSIPRFAVMLQLVLLPH